MRTQLPSPATIRRHPTTSVRSCTVRAMSEMGADPGLPGPSVGGRLTRDAALAFIQRGDNLLASGDFAEAGRYFSRVVGFDDPALTGAALLGLGEAHYRLNNEPAAVQTWQALLELPENPFTYTAWRNIAAARVRDGDLTGAIDAYREADKRAPREDKAGDRQPARLAHQGDRQHARVEALFRQGPGRRATRHDDADPDRDHGHRLGDRHVHDPGRRRRKASTTGSSSTRWPSRRGSTGACGP